MVFIKILTIPRLLDIAFVKILSIFFFIRKYGSIYIKNYLELTKNMIYTCKFNSNDSNEYYVKRWSLRKKTWIFDLLTQKQISKSNQRVPFKIGKKPLFFGDSTDGRVLIHRRSAMLKGSSSTTTLYNLWIPTSSCHLTRQETDRHTFYANYILYCITFLCDVTANSIVMNTMQRNEVQEKNMIILSPLTQKQNDQTS